MIEIMIGDGIRGDVTPELRAALRKLAPYIELMRQAASADACDFGIDQSKGIDADLSHLAPLRQAARVMKIDAQVRLRDGDISGGSDSLASIAGLSKHCSGDSVVVSSLVSASMLALQDRVIGEALDVGLDASSANKLFESLAPFDGNDPMRLQDALRAEAAANSARIEKALVDGAGAGDAQLYNTDGALVPFEPDAIRTQAATLDSIYADADRAMSLKDRDETRKALEAIDERVKSGESGELAAALTSPFAKLFDSNCRIADMLAARRQQLDDIRSGKVAPGKVANAATAYLRAAALVMGIAAEQQAELEAARVSTATLPEENRAIARRFIAALREPLRRAFRDASERERCDFAVSGFSRPSLAPSYVGPLRGAVRVLLTDALLGAGPDPLPGGKPIDLEEATAIALRLVVHLGKDPSLAHSLLATSVRRVDCASSRRSSSDQVRLRFLSR